MTDTATRLEQCTYVDACPGGRCAIPDHWPALARRVSFDRERDEQRLTVLLDKCAAALTPAEAREVHDLIDAQLSDRNLNDERGLDRGYPYVVGFVRSGITRRARQ